MSGPTGPTGERRLIDYDRGVRAYTELRDFLAQSLSRKDYRHAMTLLARYGRAVARETGSARERPAEPEP